MRVSRVIRRVAALVLAGGVAMATLAAGSAGAEERRQFSFKGKVIANGGLTIRSAPSPHTGNRGVVAKGTTVTIVCKVHATPVDGNRLWYQLSNDRGWLAARYVTNIGSVPRYCPLDDTTGGGTGSTTAPVNRRQGPHLKDARLGTLPRGAKISVVCYVRSTSVIDGNEKWYLLADRRSWVTDAFLKRDVTRPSMWGGCRS